MIALALTSTDTIHWMAVLADVAVKGLVVMLLAVGASVLLRRSSAAVRHMTWSLSIVAMILSSVLSLALPQFQVSLLPDWAHAVGLELTAPPAAVTPEPVVMDESPVAFPSLAAEYHAPASDLLPPLKSPQPESLSSPSKPLASSAAGGAAATQPPPMHWSAWVLLGWLTGVVLMMLPLLAGTAFVWRRTHRAERIECDSWLRLLDELRRQLGIRRNVTLLQSDGSSIPVTCGIFRAKILLPAEADYWPIQRRHAVLLHELAHIRRADCLTQLLARLARVMYWFNPLVWLAGRMLRIEREQACDDLVLASGQKPSDYAQHLLDIVRSLHSARCPSLAAVAMARKSQFEGRLLAILDPNRNRRGLTRLDAIAAVALITLVTIPLASLKAASTESAATSGADDGSAEIFSRPPSDAPAASVDVVDFGRLVMQVLSKSDMTTFDKLAVNDLSHEDLAWLLSATNAASLRLQDIYSDSDKAELVSSPLMWWDLQRKPITLYVQARKMAKGWVIASYRASYLGDNGIVDKFLKEHPRANHAYHAGPPAAPPGGRMFPLQLVDDDTGKPLAGVASIVQADGENYTVISDNDGMTLIPLAGQRPEDLPYSTPRLNMTIRHEEYAPRFYKVADEIPDGFTLRLPKGRTIGGTLLNENNEPISDAAIYLWINSNPPEAPVYAKLQIEATTDKQGRWRLTGIPVDTSNIFVLILHPDYILDRVWHDAGSMSSLYDQTNVITLQKSDITVSGIVYGPNGMPLAGAEVHQGKSRAGLRYPRTKTNISGQFTFPQTPPGKLMLFAMAPGCAPELTEVDAQKGIAPVEFHLSAGKTIRGRVVDADNNPIRWVNVSAASWRGRENLRWETLTDADGCFEWKEAPADNVMLRFKKADCDMTMSVTPSEELQTFTLRQKHRQEF